MEELYDGQSHWRWTEQLQDSHVIRIGDDGHVYGTDPSKPVPLRVQLVRSVLLRPIVQTPASFVMRKADVEREGKTMSCLLLSYSPVSYTHLDVYKRQAHWRAHGTGARGICRRG